MLNERKNVCFDCFVVNCGIVSTLLGINFI